MQTSDAPALRMLINRAGFTPKSSPCWLARSAKPLRETTGTGAQKYENDQASTLHAAHFPTSEDRRPRGRVPDACQIER
jgi:hypothetical protein